MRHRLENLHAAAEVAMVEARRRVRLNGGADDGQVGEACLNLGFSFRRSA